MNYDNVNTCVAPMPVNDCRESGNSRTMIDNIRETTELLHTIECNLDSIRGILWFNDGSNPEKDIEIKDMDSNIVHDLDVVKRINKKLERITRGIGC